MQPEICPIPQEQLVAKVIGMHAGLRMVEAKFIEQCQSMIALHRTLLHGHHYFLLASQHPPASPALHRLASKYAMSDEYRLPTSLDDLHCKLNFIELAYTMIILLHEVSPAFEDTWINVVRTSIAI
ncbi:hypothetical protein B0O99DRAFT_711878 [Bisporella sp. PMI_857]|nr:hypothetical protein B0O99DRAFT_711878 [Bisporella sp. PMI_857]